MAEFGRGDSRRNVTGCAAPGRSAPILVLGLGSAQRGDEGAGLRMLEALASHAAAWGNRVELLACDHEASGFIGLVGGRTALVVLDAVVRGADPGTVHTLDAPAVLSLGVGTAGPCRGGAAPLLAATALLGGLPARVVVVGVEPRHHAGSALSPAVQAALPRAVGWARAAVESLLVELGTGLRGGDDARGAAPVGAGQE